jgi:hypothetical protein
VFSGQRDGLVNPDGAKEFTKQYQRGKAMATLCHFPYVEARER